MMVSLFDRVENTVGKGENASRQHFLIFPQCFPKPSSLGLLTLSQTSPGLYRSKVQVLKTLGVEKLLLTSNFSFSHSVFYLFGELSAIFIKFEIVVCKLFQFGRVYNLLFGKGLEVGIVW